MTVIAYRDGVMASDSRAQDGVAAYVSLRKVAVGHDGVLYGATGAAGLCSEFLRWVDGGRVGDRPPLKVEDNSIEVLVARPDGSVEVWTPHGCEDYGTPEYMAAGSGAPVALGALHAGADAEGAARAGVEHGLGCGGAVQVVRR